jgi:hypothetical protein
MGRRCCDVGAIRNGSFNIIPIHLQRRFEQRRLPASLYGLRQTPQRMLERKPHHLRAAVWGKNQRKTRRREPAPFGNLPAHTLLHHAQGENPSGNLPSKAGGGMSWRAHRSSSGCTQTKVRSPAIGQPCWPNFHWCPALARRTINHHRPIPACTGDRECCAPACSREASCPNLNTCRPSFHSLQLGVPPVRSARPR